MDQEIEDLLDDEVNKFYGRCQCCLELAYVKNMWTEYSWEGAQEIYGEMLMETFSIAWDTAQNEKEQICDACVNQLRDAHMFKRKVLASEKLLKEGVLDSELQSVKEERLSDLDQYENTTEDALQESEYKQDDVHEEDTFEDELVTEEVEYEQVEYLDEEDVPNIVNAKGSKSKANTGESSKQAPPVFRHKHKRKHGYNTRNYKNYSEDTLRQGVDAALNSDMTASEVALMYGVPRKTLTARVLNAKKKPKPETPKDVEKIMNQERHYNFVQEVKKVLSFTNAVPFKVKSGRYYCAYCYTTIDSFDHPVDLRVHTHEHERELLDRLDQILRPQFINEILRVDVESLQCKVCSIPLPTWNDVFVHLNEIHDVQLDQVYTKVIPYRLKDRTVYCALCDEEFLGFHLLDVHMNAHYCNYMCSECGDTFMTETRLKTHVATHNTGKFPCDYCGKVFTLEKYKRKHEDMVHKKAKIKYKCVDCSEAFHSEYERHVHVVANHKERVRVSTCEVCGKSYDWKPYYLKHMRKAHSKVKNFICKYCGKGYVTKHEFSMHEQRHTGEGRHVCVFCDKNFVSMGELKSHLKKHVKELRCRDKNEMQFSDNIIVIDGSGKNNEP